MHLTDLIEKILTATGYEPVEVERVPVGSLRVYISQVENGVIIEDREKVSHQLTRVFEVENVNYERLEASSPGLDRPLHTLANFTRFVNLEVKVTLRLPVSGQKNFTGIIRAPMDGPGQERTGLESEGKESPALPEFALSEFDRTRLVPVLDFERNRNKGNKQ